MVTGIIGKKVGMTQLFDADGVVLPSGDFTAESAAAYPRISGVESSPQGPEGSPWGDPVVEEAAPEAAEADDAQTVGRRDRVGAVGRVHLDREVLVAQGGSLSGVVTPAGFPTAVLLIQNTDTPATTFTSTTGNYSIKGVKGGTYDIHFLPTDTSYDKSVKNGILVTDGKVTRVDTVKLSQ